MDTALEYGRQYLHDHPQADAVELGDALRRQFGLTTRPPETPSPAPHVNEVAVAEQAWYSIRLWWWWVKTWFLPRRPIVTSEDVKRVVSLLLPLSRVPSDTPHKKGDMDG